MKLVLLIAIFVAQQVVRTTTELSAIKKRQINNASYFVIPESHRQPCNVEQIEYRLSRLEVQVVEKAENVNSELKENSRRLQMLQWQNAEAHSELERLRAEIAAFIKFSLTQHSASQSPHTEEMLKIEQHLAHLTKGTQLLIASVRNAVNDIAYIKKNLSHVANNSNLHQQDPKNLVTKQFLNEELLEVKHRQKYQIQDPPPCQNNSENLPKNCKELQENGFNSGIYRIQPKDSSKPFMVLCDMDIKGGGWTYIHNRYDGTQDFYLNWYEYKHGFGNLAGEFWLGLDHIHEMTANEVNVLLIELTDDTETKYAHYSAFSIGSELEGFALKVLGGYEGDAGDSLMYHAGSRFSTKDMDQDSWLEGSCAQSHGGAWWYKSCDKSNLNGRYFGVGELPYNYLYNGMYWDTFRGSNYSLLQARMLIKPRDERSSPIVPLSSTAT